MLYIVVHVTYFRENISRVTHELLSHTRFDAEFQKLRVCECAFGVRRIGLFIIEWKARPLSLKNKFVCVICMGGGVN